MERDFRKVTCLEDDSPQTPKGTSLCCCLCSRTTLPGFSACAQQAPGRPRAQCRRSGGAGSGLWGSALDKHKAAGYVARGPGVLPPDRAPVPVCGEGLLCTRGARGHLQSLITRR